MKNVLYSTFYKAHLKEWSYSGCRYMTATRSKKIYSVDLYTLNLECLFLFSFKLKKIYYKNLQIFLKLLENMFSMNY